MKAPTVRHAVRVTRGIVYGHAMVQANAVPRSRPLLLDRYEPAVEPVSGMRRPVLVMAFGGAFHRGDRQFLLEK